MHELPSLLEVEVHTSRRECTVKEQVTAFVLAGGKSSRMGRDKAFLELPDGEILLTRMSKTARAVTPHVRIIGDAKKFAAWGEVVEDIYPEHGPLGGIHAALAGTRTDLNLIVPIDMPLLTAEFLRFLMEKAQHSPATVIVPKAGGRLHPLCATYRKNFVDVAKRSLESNRNRIDSLYSEVRTQVIEEDEILKNGFSPSLLRNVNTPKDWEELQAANSTYRGI